MGHSRLTARQWMILGLVALCAPLGDTCLSRGMTQVPVVTLAHPASLIAAVFTPWIAVGIALLMVIRRMDLGRKPEVALVTG